MPITVTCPSCQKTFPVKDKYAGKKGACPHCGGPIKVPAQATDGPNADAPTAAEDDWLSGIESEPAATAPAPAPAAARATPSPPAAPPRAAAKAVSAAETDDWEEVVPNAPMASKPAAAPQRSAPAPAALSKLPNPLRDGAKPAPVKPANIGAPAGGVLPPIPTQSATMTASDDFLSDLAGLPVGPPLSSAGALRPTSLTKSRSPQATKRPSAGSSVTMLWAHAASAVAILLTVAFAYGAFAGARLGLIGVSLLSLLFVGSLLVGILIVTVKMYHEGRFVLATIGLLINLIPMIIGARAADRWGMSWLRPLLGVSFLCVIVCRVALQFAVVDGNRGIEASPSSTAQSPHYGIERIASEDLREPPKGNMLRPVPDSLSLHDRVERGLNGISSADQKTRLEAISLLESVTPTDECRALVTAQLERQVNRWWIDDAMRSMGIERGKLIDIYRRWATLEHEPFLIEALESDKWLMKGVELSLMDKIAGFGTKQGSVALARLLENPLAHEDAARYLRKMGPIAERAVWPLLQSKNDYARRSACEVLAKVGSVDSISQMISMPIDTRGEMQKARYRAIEEIQSRFPNDSTDGLATNPSRDVPAELPQEITRALDTLLTWSAFDRRDAVKALVSAELTDGVRHRVLRKLEFYFDEMTHGRLEDASYDDLVQLYAHCAGPENEEKLIELLIKEKPLSGSEHIINALARLMTDRSAQVVAEQLNNFHRRHEAMAALRGMGSFAEQAVWPILGSEDIWARVAACEVLADIGTMKSAERIQAMPDLNIIGDKADIQERAVRAIRGRNNRRGKASEGMDVNNRKSPMVPHDVRESSASFRQT